MKRVLVVLLSLFVITTCTNRDSSVEPDIMLPDIPPLRDGATECIGDFRLELQAEVGEFNALGCTQVTGDLLIGWDQVEPKPENQLTSLAGFPALTSVGGDLEILYAAELRNADVFSDLATIGGRLLIAGNARLEVISRFLSLTSVGEDLGIFGNWHLTEIRGFPLLTHVPGEFGLHHGENLTTIDAFPNLVSVGGKFGFVNNPLLTTLGPFPSLTSVGGLLGIALNHSLSSVTGFPLLNFVGGDFGIANNDALQEIVGFPVLASTGQLRIQGNQSLTELDAFAALTSVEEDLWIRMNPQLSDCVCGLCDLIASGGVGGHVLIEGNGAGCATPGEMLESCFSTTLLTDIEELLASDILSNGESNSLDSKVDNALDSVAKGNIDAAINKLQAFINQIEALIQSGRLTPEQGQPLIDAAQAVIDQLNST